jgi:glutaminyl-peptide cyclotransferase
MNPLRLLLCCVCASLMSCDAKEKQAAQVAKSLYRYDESKALFREFSGAKAMEHIKAQVAIGPRPAGSEALGKCREYLKKILTENGWQVQEQRFKEFTPIGEIEFVNVRARLPVAGSDTWKRPCAILLGSHYDTKLFKSFEFVGANDAGSSTGALLEFSRIFGKRADAGQFVELCFFDGEEAIVEYSGKDGNPLPDDGLFGSRHYAREIRTWPAVQLPLFMILLDMVGDKDLKIEMPLNTTPLLRKKVMEAAQERDYGAYFAEGRGNILDDHYPFLLSGIPAVNLIDLNYPAWHTSLDKMENLSERSLQIVGETTLHLIERLLSTANP